MTTVGIIPNAAQILGLILTTGLIGVLVAVFYRWYTREIVPEGLPVLIGLAVVAVYLNTTTALGQVIGGASGLFELEVAIVNVGVFIFGGIAALVGRLLGDRLAQELADITGMSRFETEMRTLVKTVGRTITVTLPSVNEIEDIDGYDPVSHATKDAMAEQTLMFPRRLTVEELRDRLLSRLKEDFGVGHVGLEIGADGTIQYLAVGSRASGIGPTIAPGTAVTTVKADPPFAATSGDIVQLWESHPEKQRIATGELRGRNTEFVTLALDQLDAEALDPTESYRLITLPTDPRVEREFARLLRNADETMGVMTITDGSALMGQPVGAIEPTVIAIKPSDEPIEALPRRTRVLNPGDTIYTIARPEVLRRIESAVTTVVEAESS